MKAVLLNKVTEAKDIALSEVPIPSVRPGWVLVKVKAFGLNHSEKLLRLNEIRADYIYKPIVPGIECVGEIADPSDSGLAIGQKVAALMGGMGRSFWGSYAEYALCRAGSCSRSKAIWIGRRSALFPRHISPHGAACLNACICSHPIRF